MSTDDYAAKPAVYFERARSEVLDHLPPALRAVVDIGGSSGATLSAIKARYPQTRTICIDGHGPALEIARQRGHVVQLCDLDREAPALSEDCDAILLLDVLEHLVDPWRVLGGIVAHARTGTTIIVSLPNVRFWRVSLGLVFAGRWRLAEAGVLDRTHLRFFTRESGSEMVKGAGLMLTAVRGLVTGGRRFSVLDRITLGSLQGFLCAQYLFVAVKV